MIKASELAEMRKRVDKLNAQIEVTQPQADELMQMALRLIAECGRLRRVVFATINAESMT